MATFNCHPRNRRLTAEEVKFCEDMFQVKNLKKYKILILNLKFIFSLLKTKGKVCDIHRLAQQKLKKKLILEICTIFAICFTIKHEKVNLALTLTFYFISSTINLR